MFTSIATDFRNSMSSWPEIENSLRCMAEAGYTHAHWCHDWKGDYIYSKAEMMQTRNLLRSCDIKVNSIHGPESGENGVYVDKVFKYTPQYRCTKIRKDFTNTNEYMREAGVDLLKNRIDFCTHIGASAMVLHIQLPYEFFKANPKDKIAYYDAVYRSFDELEPYATVCGVRLAIENLYWTPPEIEDEKFELLFKRYSPDYMGLCYDSCHGPLVGFENDYHFLEKYTDRLICTHLSDSKTTSKDLKDLFDFNEVLTHDIHAIPFEGVLDWERITRAVAKSPVTFPVDFEVSCKASTREDEHKLLVDCRKKIEKVNNMLIKYRESNDTK